MFFLYTNKEQMGNAQFFTGIGWNFKNVGHEKHSGPFILPFQPCHLSADTQPSTIPEFTLPISNQNGHSLADGISKSQQAVHLVQPARAHLRLRSQNTDLLLGFLILCSSFHCSLYRLGLFINVFKVFFPVKSNQVSAVFHIIQQPSSI